MRIIRLVHMDSGWVLRAETGCVLVANTYSVDRRGRGHRNLSILARERCEEKWKSAKVLWI
jgi:hypothetical protein